MVQQINGVPKLDVQVIIGLGNPGQAYHYNRHSIGFRVLDELADQLGGIWRDREDMKIAEVAINGKKILLVKPQTFMNASGRVIPFLTKRGIKAENILVVHDELEQPFGKVSLRVGGSARGHNGLKSLIASCGDQFARVRCGIGRPEQKEEVAIYVLQNFSESFAEVDQLIKSAIAMIQKCVVMG
jgi:PTH1 family peptidyl-tRNA hydrolase